MSSKKITGSLMSLVIIVALAFIAPIATAQIEFGVQLDMTGDIGASAGLQVAYPTDNILQVVLYFDQAVVLETTHLEISGFDASETYDPAVVLAASYPIWPITAARGIRVSITVTPGTSKVTLGVAGGIPSDNPLNADTSAAFTADIGILQADVVGDPKVYNIRRADNSVVPLTGGAVNVVITLSEQPLTFDATHINVTNATAGTPVALGATAQNVVGTSVVADYVVDTGLLGPKPPLRTVPQLSIVIYEYMNNTVLPPAEFIEAVRALRTAVRNIAPAGGRNIAPAGGNAKYWSAPATYQVLWGGNPADPYMLFPLVNDVVPMPITQGTADLTDSTTTFTIPAEGFDRSAEEPTVPNAADYNTQAEYQFALDRYNLFSGTSADTQRTAYQNELIAYQRYIDLQDALQAHDVTQQQQWDQDLAETAAPQQIIPQDSLPPTGRDGLLHPYLVTISPTYANNSPVVVKVNQWANTDATAVYYNPPTLENEYIEGFDKLTIAVFATAVIVPPPPPVVQKQADEVVLPPGFGFIFPGAPRRLSPLEIQQIQEQIDRLSATDDRSPAAMRTLAYLQKLLETTRPEKTQLLANYPNPFNPETWIPYELATDTQVRITIYNTQGRVIRTLSLGQQAAGYYTHRDRAAYWDGRNALGEHVASGVYFYQLQTDEMSTLRKMVILK